MGGKYLPSNSLLQSTPEFESASKANTIITQEHTSTIENIIKLHVLGEYWDNIIPRALPDVRSRRGEDEALKISKDKPKLGLGELYEQEYLKKDKILDVEAEEKKTSEDNIRYETRGQFADLCSRLDAL